MRQLGVGWQRTVCCTVDAQDIRQQLRIHTVRLGACNAMPLPVASDSQRVDRIDLPTSAPQTRDHQTARRLDRDRDGFVLVVAMLGEYLEQQLIAEVVVDDPPSGQHNPALVNERHVVVVFGPVGPAEHLHSDTTLQIRVGEKVCGARWRSNGRARGPASQRPFVTSATGRASVSAGAQDWLSVE